MSGRVETIGRATLYLGDCREVIKVLPCPAGVLTDPPFGIAYQSGHATDTLWAGGRRIANDQDTSVRDEALGECDLLGRPPMLVFGSRKRPEPADTKMVLIWDKGPALGMGDLSLPWKPTTEEIYVLNNGWVGARATRAQWSITRLCRAWPRTVGSTRTRSRSACCASCCRASQTA